MLLKHRSIRVLLFVLISTLLSTLAPTTPAYAASDYDGVIKTSDSLVIKYAGLPDVDVSFNYTAYLYNSYPGGAAGVSCDSDCSATINDSLDHGDWAIYTTETSYPVDRTVAYFFYCDKKMTATFGVYGSSQKLVAHASDNGAMNCAQGSIEYLEVNHSMKVVGGVTNQYLGGFVIADNTISYNLFVYTGAIDYPENYEGEIPASTYTPPPAKYVAMGDSFSSGEGNPPFEGWTDINGVNKCHRSFQAYPRLLQSSSSLELGQVDFVACSGATTSDVLNGQWNEPAQVDALSNDTRIVTITVGGNDIKFKDFAIACVMGTTCDSTSSEYQDSWAIMTDSSRSDYLPGKLELLLDTVKTYLYANPNFKVYVVGYPYVVTHASWEDNAVGTCNYLTEAEANAAMSIVQELDATIQTAVTVFDDPRFVYVDPLATGSPFLGHELCTNGGYFNGIEAAGFFGGNDAYVFHPNENGQQAYADLIESYMS